MDISYRIYQRESEENLRARIDLIKSENRYGN